jgi:hypothetical protein
MSDGDLEALLARIGAHVDLTGNLTADLDQARG